MIANTAADKELAEAGFDAEDVAIVTGSPPELSQCATL